MQKFHHSTMTTKNSPPFCVPGIGKPGIRITSRSANKRSPFHAYFLEQFPLPNPCLLSRKRPHPPGVNDKIFPSGGDLRRHETTP